MYLWVLTPKLFNISQGHSILIPHILLKFGRIIVIMMLFRIIFQIKILNLKKNKKAVTLQKRKFS